MKFLAEIEVMPHKELLDPQGKTVANNMKNLDIHGVEDVRIGKHILMRLEAASEAEAREKVDTACKKLLANIIMETYEYALHPISE
jgi:phosphoribosylformylglycinamidine synthase